MTNSIHQFHLWSLSHLIGDPDLWNVEETEKLAQVVRTWGGYVCPSTNRWRRVLYKDNFDSDDVTRKLAEIQTQM